jgi:hypothetical protein
VTKLYIPKKGNVTNVDKFLSFIQSCIYKFWQGFLRYGPQDKSKRYLTRLEKELKRYKETGNLENLHNVAVYAALEAIKPENDKFHFDPTVESATRHLFEGCDGEGNSSQVAFFHEGD